jgi:hypothetical protein
MGEKQEINFKNKFYIPKILYRLNILSIYKNSTNINPLNSTFYQVAKKLIVKEFQTSIFNTSTLA